MMDILAIMLFGLIAGAIAKFIMSGNQVMGWILTIILGIVGSFVGSAIYSLTGLGSGVMFALNFWSIFSAVLGAIIVLLVYGALTKGRG